MFSAFPILLYSEWLSLLISLLDNTLVWIFIIIPPGWVNLKREIWILGLKMSVNKSRSNSG